VPAPAHEWLRRSWAGNPRRAELDARAAERDEHGAPVFELVRLVRGEYEVTLQQPADPRAGREPVEVAEWLVGQPERERAAEHARLSEQDDL
jgi:hypothetical protein